MRFGERLYELRDRRFMTKTELADKLCTSRQMIKKYELGISIPTVDILLRAANFFEISADFLLGRNEYTTLPKDNKENYMVLSDKLTDEDIETIRMVANALEKKHTKKSI